LYMKNIDMIEST